MSVEGLTETDVEFVSTGSTDAEVGVGAGSFFAMITGESTGAVEAELEELPALVPAAGAGEAGAGAGADAAGAGVVEAT